MTSDPPLSGQPDSASSSPVDEQFMRTALELARLGRGLVEPNPMVGSVVVRDGVVVGQGYHARYGGPHAEIAALEAAGDRARGATVYVTLEPCCHHGKTPPCTDALVAAGVARVVVAQRDPFHAVDGRGIEQLRAAGIKVTENVLHEAAIELNAPYRKLAEQRMPWVIAKWAMTLDGKLATRRKDSRWISNRASREVVHQLRGRVDAIVVGIGTVLADDPLLTARPPGPRTARRIVVDWDALTPLSSQLVRSADSVPVVVAVGDRAPASRMQALEHCGCELVGCHGDGPADRLRALLSWMGARRMTNVLVEGGGGLLGSLFDLRAIDEVLVIVAPKLVGGASAVTPIAGVGLDTMASAATLTGVVWTPIENDLHIQGRVVYA